MIGERGLSDLVRDLMHETSTLIRQELALAGAEVEERMRGLGRDAAWIAAGVLLAQLAALSVAGAAILGLVDLGLRAWLAAALVATAAAIAAAMLIQAGLRGVRSRMTPPVHTIESLKETAQWLKSHAG